MSTRLDRALATLRWSYGTLAVELALSPSTIRNWARGRTPAPPELIEWLERLAAAHEAEPVPAISKRAAGNPNWVRREPVV